MFLKSNAHLKELTDFLQKNFSEYIFKSDSSLNLIEIITKKNAKKGKCESENVLAVGEDDKVRLIFFEHNSKILDIEKQAQDFMSKASEKAMIHPDYLSSDWFDKGNKECVQLGDEVETGWGVAANYISKDELIHLLKGGILADYTSGEYSHFYKLDDEALGMVQKSMEIEKVDNDRKEN